jgi:hypothetical protein
MSLEIPLCTGNLISVATVSTIKKGVKHLTAGVHLGTPQSFASCLVSLVLSASSPQSEVRLEVPPPFPLAPNPKYQYHRT